MYEGRIRNPENIPNACTNFTRIAKQIYKKGGFKFQKESQQTYQNKSSQNNDECCNEMLISS